MDKMREEFEAWCLREKGFMPRRRDDNYGYIFDTTDDMWRAWKASRSVLCVNLPLFDNGSIRGYSGDCEEANMVVDAIAESLHCAGVPFK